MCEKWLEELQNNCRLCLFGELLRVLAQVAAVLGILAISAIERVACNGPESQRMHSSLHLCQFFETICDSTASALTQYGIAGSSGLRGNSALSKSSTRPMIYEVVGFMDGLILYFL